ncbi:unnamed protein product, partial [Prorocentrum cordatum]
MYHAPQLGYAALGSLVASSVRHPTCVCDCTPPAPDEGVLELLGQQLQRGGPERLTACPEAAACPVAPECPGLLGPLLAAVAGGALVGCVLAVLVVVILGVGGARQRARGVAALQGCGLGEMEHPFAEHFGLREGDFAAVEYNCRPRDLRHERCVVLLPEGETEQMGVVTLDGDCYLETWALPEVASWTRLPNGSQGGDLGDPSLRCYRFRQVGLAIAALAAPLPLPPQVEGPPAPRGEAGAPAGATVGDGLGAGRPPGRWVTAEERHGIARLTPWEAPPAACVVGDRALVQHAGRPLVLMQEDDDDLRALSVVWDRMNERRRTWESVVENLSEKSFTDWPLMGPRAAVRLCRHIRLIGGGPTAFSTRVVRDMKMLNIGNLACMGLVGRGVQLIMGASSGGGAAVWEGSEHFMGLGRRARGIAPALQSHVAARLKDETEVDKQRDKAREARRRHQRVVREACEALNWMAGAVPPADGGPTREVQEVVCKDVGFLASHYADAAFAVPSEAARSLLRRKVGCGPSGSPARPFVKGLVSLPADAADCPLAAEMLGERERSMIERLPIDFLCDEEEMRSEPPVKPYMGPRLRGGSRAYVDVVRELQSMGIVTSRRQRRAECAMFVVAKKDGRLRLIVDAHAANREFRGPPGVALATVENFASVEVGPKDNLYISKGDVSNCVDRLGIDGPLCDFVGLPPIEAGALGIGLVEGASVAQDEFVHPCLRALPMGFTWSLFFAQRAVQNAVYKVPRLCPENALENRSCNTVFDTKGMSLAHYVSVDNVGVLGLEANEVQQVREAATRALGEVGLVTRELTTSTHVDEAL